MKRWLVSSLVAVSVVVTVYVAAPIISTKVAVWLGTVETLPQPTGEDEAARMLREASGTVDISAEPQGRLLGLSK